MKNQITLPPLLFIRRIRKIRGASSCSSNLRDLLSDLRASKFGPDFPLHSLCDLSVIAVPSFRIQEKSPSRLTTAS